MNWRGINLEEKLNAEKNRSGRLSEDEVLAAFRQLLAREDLEDDRILENIFGGASGAVQLEWRNLDPERVYHIDHIKNLCTHYRLRFLDGKYFKGEIPYEAIAKVKRLQRQHEQELKGFKIMAPAPMFNLKNKDKDPLLFLPLGNQHYYLVHKWGRDLHPLRKLIVWPFRNFKTLLSCVAGLALLIVACIPSSVMMSPYDSSSLGLRVICFFYLFIAFSGLTVLYGFSRVKDFNSRLWDSRYMD